MTVHNVPWTSITEAAMHIHRCQCNGMGFVKMPVPVGHPLFGKAIPCVCTQSERARQEAERLRAQANVSATVLQSHTFAAFSPAACKFAPGVDPGAGIETMSKIKDVCQQFANHPRGWINLIGFVGSGKTHLAHAIVGQCLARGIAAYWDSVPSMLNSLRAGYKNGQYEEMHQRLQRVPVMVLDDLGAERSTDWVVDELFQILNYRYEERLPLVVTSNLDLTQRDAQLNARLQSRLGDANLVRTYTLPASDYRYSRRAA